jgi:hypothetical protein
MGEPEEGEEDKSSMKQYAQGLYFVQKLVFKESLLELMFFNCVRVGRNAKDTAVLFQ